MSSDCKHCIKNLECEGCSFKLCQLCIFKFGCCSNTHTSLCEECFGEQLDLGSELFGFICNNCDEIILTCCVNFGQTDICKACELHN